MNTIFKNPYINSIFAEIYIIIVVSAIHLFARPNTPDTFLDPVVAISLFVLSAAVMGYLFLGEPVQLYLNGEKRKAISSFLKTVLGFALITIVATVALKLYPINQSPKKVGVSAQESITALFVQKYDEPADTFDIKIGTSTENFAKGTVNNTNGSGGVWFAVNTSSGWELAYDGNGIVPCDAVNKYSFPKEMAPQCIDTQNGNRLIKR